MINYRKQTWVINRCFDCLDPCELSRRGDIPEDCPLDKATEHEFNYQ
jgi:hypothetical protein